ncbi:RNA-guided endonuclease TnpB family protein [Microbispora sp. GKU 823]|uniref:RNA-guided endonuclease InsQ/TnpB family protein n=1 Tax=Microbispora sp. GKU 823 TaxID=1652100 RepID=UPI0009A2A9E4|nr:RNA-guided endonuclease TnpB family protein [Microbispora sp. GKU 823]OPG07902.1 transposase [Microbispora sp. GKU 823]
MRTAYKVRIYPTHEQAAVLNRTFGCVRLVWNTVLAWRHARYRTEGVTTSYAQSDRYLTELKRDGGHDFLYEISSVPLQQALRHQYTAFANFFAGRARYPRFKSRHGRQSATYTRSAFRWRDGRLWLAKMDEPLELVWSWAKIDLATLDPTTVTISRDPDGRWYACLAVETEAEPEPVPAAGSAVGVDLGVKDFAVTSVGQRIANPRHLERRAHNLARYQRRMARKQRGSNNRAKAKAKVARAHTKVRDARADFLHKTTSRLVRDHDLIVIEDLNVKGMVRNRHLARVISDCGWGEFRRQLEYKTRRYGRHLIVVDRWYPSSKTCSACGHLLAELSLSTRHWTCPDCGTRHDRDVNAAKNILAAGRAVSACGADVSHSGSSRVRSAVKQEAQPVRAGIPRL